jgi:hypothetical protein
MLLFYCAHCTKVIAADNSESTGQIVDRLDEHITRCGSATFTYEGTSNIARRRLGDLRLFLEERPAGKMRLQRFAKTHDPEIREEIYRLARLLGEMEKLEKR